MSTGFCRWLVLIIWFTICLVFTNSKEIRVVCYYTNWSIYRPGSAKFSPQNINPYLCTHLVYAFGGFTKENTLKPFDKYQDIEKGGYAKFTGLKTYNKNLKTLLAIGGWNEGSSRFSPMVANADRRKELVKNTIKFLRQNNFDGLDLDWEYPSFRDGGKPRDRDNYAQLVQELREEFERESEKTGRIRLLLTMAVPAGIEYINKGYDVPKLTKYLDWMNILSYDYHSAFEPAVNHHAPLYSLEEESEYNYDTELNIDYTIKHYLKAGANPNKLVLGIPTYGRSYTLFNPDANDIGAPADGPGDMGEATRENGYLAYYEICENIKTQEWEVVQPNTKAMGPYAFKGNQWVGYDDDKIARRKAKYVAENNLGGIMFWSIDNDDFRGNCHGKPYPIIEAAKEALISAYGLSPNVIQSTAKPIKSKTRSRVSSTTTEAPKKETNIRRRNRNKLKIGDRTKSRKTTTPESEVYSSLELVTPSYTTPAPPSTPDQGGSFKCEDEGFFPHPKDCKKYFWCLSGAGELGIIAHQFTCPAGLYFNKAADSCDYTQNVLCNKKLSKTTTTSTTTTSTTTTEKSIKSSTRPLFRSTTTTTEATPDEDYEYEDEEEEDENNSEDPKVIKELLDLIKKAGGIEQLEKQLKFEEDDDSASINTTPSIISKTLVQRVLNSATKNKQRQNTYNVFNRNSRGPQNEGLSRSEEVEQKEKSKLTYTTISRQRPQKSIEEDVDEKEVDDIKTKSRFKQPEYVSIKRERPNSTRGLEKEDRNKILGEDIEDIDEDEVEDSSNQKRAPQYVSIRRQRPSTTEETSTSKYTIIRRGSTTEANKLNVEPNQDDSALKYQTITRTTSTEATSTRQEVTKSSEIPETVSTTTESDLLTTLSPLLESLNTVTISSSDVKKSEISPILSEPRPFSIPTSTTQTKPIETVHVTKVSEPNYQKNIKSKETSTPINTRARSKESSRFKFTSPATVVTQQATLKPIVSRTRHRFSTTTTESSEVDDDLIRTYRPSEIADLSSLTAVDFGLVRDFNQIPGSRSRRIRPSTTTTTTEKLEESFKTGRRTLPLARKILENAQFGGSRRNVSPSPLSTDQIDSSSNVKSLKRVRGTLTNTTTEAPIQSSTVSNSRFTPRTRKVIRRFRPSTTETVIESDLQKANSFYPNNRRRLSRTSTASSSTTTEYFTTTISPNDVGELGDEESGEELENIKLSESNIRENNAVNSGNSILDSKNVKNFKGIKSKTIDDFKNKIDTSTTEPNIIIRTRKIIRKLKATTPSESTSSSTPSTTESVEVTTLGRRRKIIRRLRPTSETTESTLSTASLGVQRKGRPTTPSTVDEQVYSRSRFNSLAQTKLEKGKIFSRRGGRFTTTSSSTAAENSTSPVEEFTLGRGYTTTPSSFDEDIATTLKLSRGSSRLTTLSPNEEGDFSSERENAASIVRGRGRTTTPPSFDEEISITLKSSRGSSRLTTLSPNEEEDSSSEKENATSIVRGRGRTTTPSSFNEEISTTLKSSRGSSRLTTLSPNEEEDSSLEKENSASIVRSRGRTTTPSSFDEEISTTLKSSRGSSRLTTLSPNEEEGSSLEKENATSVVRGRERTTTPSSFDEEISTTLKLSRGRNRLSTLPPNEVANKTKLILNRARSKFSLNATSTTESFRNITVANDEKNQLNAITTSSTITTTNSTEETLSNEEFETTTVLDLEEITNNVEQNLTTTEAVELGNKTEIETTTASTINTTTAATISTKAYKNPILENQKRRPPLQRIRLTSPTPTSVAPTPTISRSRFRFRSTTTPSTPSTTVTPTSTLEYTTTEDEAIVETTEAEIAVITSPSDNNLTVSLETTTQSISSIPARTSETSTASTRTSFRPSSPRPKFSRKPLQRITNRFTSSTSTSTAATPLSVRNRLQYRYSTQSSRQFYPSNRFNKEEEEKVEDEEVPEEEEEEEEEEYNDDADDVDEELEDENDDEDENRNEYPQYKTITRGSTSKPSTRLKSVSYFGKTTEAPKTTNDLSGIDAEAVKNRNKNLFTKKRKMNTPFAGGATTASNSTSPTSIESITLSSINDSTINATTTSSSVSSVGSSVASTLNSTSSTSTANSSSAFIPIISSTTVNDSTITIAMTTTPTTPIVNQTMASLTVTTPEVSESVTKPTTSETTEMLTTLHHIFAETEPSTDKQNSSAVDSKVEKLIEVNRIVEVHADREFKDILKSEDTKVLDKIGAVNRVTVIKIIDPNENEIKKSGETTIKNNILNIDDVNSSAEVARVTEIPNPNREERKFEIFGQSKVASGSKIIATKPEIIDGRSHINIITPRPYYSTEASTISLEALFQTDTPQQKLGDLKSLRPSEDELLETEHSRYVNVRVLTDDKPESRQVQDYITMKAEVVEVTPSTRLERIKIVPIKVEMTKRLIGNTDFHTTVDSGVPKVDIKLLHSE